MAMRSALNLVTGLALLVLLPSAASAVPVNIAPGQGTASQSSTDFGGAASRAIDDNTNGNYFAGSVSHTALEAAAFWEVSFLDDFVIDNVTVFNRTDCCGDRLRNVRLSVFDGASEVFGTDLFTAPGTFAPESFNVDTVDATGDRVRIQYLGAGANRPGDSYLQLAEVQVFAEPPGTGGSVPEPATMALLGAGLLGLAALRRRQRARG
jgi:hypothetical protein